MPMPPGIFLRAHKNVKVCEQERRIARRSCFVYSEEHQNACKASELAFLTAPDFTLQKVWIFRKVFAKKEKSKYAEKIM